MDEELAQLKAALHTDPDRVARAVTPLVDAARSDGDATSLSAALAVRGRARRSLGAIDLAESDLRAAADAGSEAGDDDLVADAHIGLAGVLSFAGRPQEAFEHLDSAAQIGSTTSRAYAELQRAVVSQRIGDTANALASYDAALPTLRQLQARVDIALVLMNRGVIRTQAGAAPAAVADLTEAAALFAAEEHAFGVAQTAHGLGWAHARLGDLPTALAHLDSSVEQFAALGHDALEVQIDRVEVLLAAGLSTDAFSLGRHTAERLGAAGNHSQAAEAWLLCAQAARLDGDREAAETLAQRARQLFAGQGAVGWERAALLEVLRSSTRGRSANELQRLAGQLDASGNATGAATALALACDAAAARGDIQSAARLAADCGERASRLGILEARLLAATAAATTALADGDAAAAKRSVRSGLEELRRRRLSLGASDARAAVASHADRLAGIGLRMATADGRPAVVLEWMERVREGRNHAPALPPLDPDLAVLLAELRTVAAELRSRETEGADASDLIRRQAALEDDIRHRHLRLAGGGREPARWAPPSTGDIRAVLDGKLLLELAVIDQTLIGVVVGRRRARVANLGPAEHVAAAAATVASALRAMATDRLQAALRTLGDIVAPVVAGDEPVVLVVPAAMHAVPWHAVPGLIGRPVTVAPSATWLCTSEHDPPGPGQGPAVAVAGPRLVEAEREARAAAGAYEGAVVLAGANATTKRVAAALESASVAHLAVHGHLRHDNPLWSSLELVDGPLYVYDLERMQRTAPVVVAAACDSGVAGSRPGDQLLGLSATLLGLGTRSLVASLCPLPDTAATRELMTGLHERIAAGASPPAALAACADQTTGVACFGAP